MEKVAIIFGAFGVGLAASVILKRFFKKEIPLYGDTYVPLLGITLNDRDKRLLFLAGMSLVLCVVSVIWACL